MAKTRQKTPAELRAEIRRLRTVGVGEKVAAVLNNAIRYGCLLGIAHYSYKSIVALSGEVTTTNVAVQFVTDLKIGEWAAYVVAILAGGYGWRQRRLRRDTIERLAPRLATLERDIDPGRSSSSLTPRGDTRPEDKL